MRKRDILATVLLLAVVACSQEEAHLREADQEVVRVVDGDTLVINGKRIRLHGIDAPETDQECRQDGSFWLCGKEATSQLRKRIGTQAVRCTQKDKDRYGRIVAVCTLDGEDLNSWMVAQGWALAYRKYSEDYVDEEAKAKASELGIWGSEFVAPWDWRKEA